MSTPPLHRLFNLLQLGVDEALPEDIWAVLTNKPNGDDEPSLLEELLSDWNDYLSGDKDAEEAFFGKRQKGVGSYAARAVRAGLNFHKELVFLDLLYFEKYPEKFHQNTVRERLISLITAHSKRGSLVIEEGSEKELESLEREYRRFKGNNKLPISKS